MRVGIAGAGLDDLTADLLGLAIFLVAEQFAGHFDRLGGRHVDPALLGAGNCLVDGGGFGRRFGGGRCGCDGAHGYSYPDFRE